MIDLHIHSKVTTPGDGGDSSPSEIVNRAKEIGLNVIALTDHDSVKGIPEAYETALRINQKFVPGVEIACNFNNLEIEIIALGIDFEIMNEYMRKTPDQTIAKKIDFINRSKDRCVELGLKFIDITVTDKDIYMDELHEVVFGTYSIEDNRKICQKLTGIYPQTEDMYYKTLFAPGKPCRVIKETRGLQEAIDKTHEAKGKAFLAHPKRADNVLANLSNVFIEKAIDLGLDGIECIHSKMMPKDSVFLMELCEKRGLLMSGGSDTHGLSVLESWNKRIQVPDYFINWYFDSL